uniref:DnaJ heat shock protein family (Hsp40) member C9 n=1 Tax=Macaca mulatta TaxID=9544 RepID=A0A5F7Z8P3_MACMU
MWVLISFFGLCLGIDSDCGRIGLLSGALGLLDNFTIYWLPRHPASKPPARLFTACSNLHVHLASILGKVYSVLSDREQRAAYDEQGTVDEDSLVLTQDRDWEAYWRLLFKKISLEDIQAFEKTYKGSEEELADIKQAYLDFKGDMDQIMESVLCVQYTEEPRIRSIIQQAIDTGEIPSYNAFVKESKQKMNARKRRAQEEAKEAEMSRKELGLDEGVDSLKAAIQSRQKDRQKEMDNFLAQMEAKYCKSSKGGGKKSLKKEKK